MKAIFVVLVLVIVAGAAYFLGKNGLSVSFNKATSTPAASTPSTPLGTSSLTTLPTAQPTATPDDTAALIAAVKAGLVAEHGQDAASMTITISKIEGDYAKGMASEQGGGGIWFAAKVNGTWKLVWDGNGQINCSSIAPYPAFPTSMIPECWNETTNKLITR
jgi:hypothetical protein